MVAGPGVGSTIGGFVGGTAGYAVGSGTVEAGLIAGGTVLGGLAGAVVDATVNNTSPIDIDLTIDPELEENIDGMWGGLTDFLDSLFGDDNSESDATNDPGVSGSSALNGTQHYNDATQGVDIHVRGGRYKAINDIGPQELVAPVRHACLASQAGEARIPVCRSR